jgi:hypothetical protein
MAVEQSTNIETLTNARITARLVGFSVYLKEIRKNSWILVDKEPKTPYYIIHTDGKVEDIRK